ncbi:MAG TPA: leucine-rich repeat domain-containing protein, partial [Dehalococcoidia bacterium]|nr:leucine-rich repeat domain-containing protein [Dehalococcoidia bacterium]
MKSGANYLIANSTMNDRDTLTALQKLVGAVFPYELHGEDCIEIDLTSKDYRHQGLIRHHSNTEKTEILKLISKLDRLQSINLRWNKVYKLPEDFAELRELKHLDLGSNYLGTAPAWIANLIHLKYLNLGVNELTILPEEFSKLTELQTLA